MQPGFGALSRTMSVVEHRQSNRQAIVTTTCSFTTFVYIYIFDNIIIHNINEEANCNQSINVFNAKLLFGATVLEYLSTRSIGTAVLALQPQAAAGRV